MKLTENNKCMLDIEKGKKNNWKRKSQKYIKEMQAFLDKSDSINDLELKKEIISQALKCDNELTILAEHLFEECYKKGYEDGKER